MVRENFNETHPEKQESETFYMNCFKGDEARMLRHLSERMPEFVWRSGNVAYTPSGEIVHTHSPLFKTEREW